MKENFLFNDQIPQGEYLVLDENGNKLGVLEKSEIVKLSEEKEIDMVLINTNSNPKVIRLMDFSRFRYQQQKKMKEISKKQKVIIIKEIRINPNIENNDLNIKINKVISFLSKGFKVKFIIRFRGRMINNTVLGKEIFQKISQKLMNIGFLEINPKIEGNRMIAVFSSKQKQ
ncbi:translation initiation factor IF-3 [Candidatus Phytoplasma oryzae]|nr:translation initiation factor IF-3 [Candidatus Phytoplasma oryzae]